MLQAELHDVNGQSLGDISDFGFSLSSVTDALKQAASGAQNAIKSVASAACGAAPAVNMANQSIGSKYQSTVAAGTSVAQGICAMAKPKPAPAPAPVPVSVPTRQPAEAMRMVASSGAAAAAQAAQAARAAIQTAVKKYPVGSIQWLDVTKGKWIIAIPIGTSISGFAGYGVADQWGDCIFGDCGSLGQDAGATHQPAEETDAPAPGVTTVSEKDGKERTGQGSKSLFKKPMFWAAVAGGAAVLGTGGYFLLRRKRTP